MFSFVEAHLVKEVQRLGAAQVHVLLADKLVPRLARVTPQDACGIVNGGSIIF